MPSWRLHAGRPQRAVLCSPGGIHSARHAPQTLGKTLRPLSLLLCACRAWFLIAWKDKVVEIATTNLQEGE